MNKNKTLRNILIAVMVLVGALGVVGYAHFFGESKYWGETHSLLHGDRTFTDSTGNYMLKMSMYQEYGILTTSDKTTSYILYFQSQDRYDRYDHKMIYVDLVDHENDDITFYSDQDHLAYGGWEYYEDTNDLLVIWIDRCDSGRLNGIETDSFVFRPIE